MEKERLLAENKAKAKASKKRVIVVVIIATIALIIGVDVLYNNVLKPNGIYNTAMNALNGGNYDEATSLFESLGNYKDAITQRKECQYQKGISLLNEGDTYAGLFAFRKAGRDYKDVSNQLAKIGSSRFVEGLTEKR